MDVRIRYFTVERGITREHFTVYWDYNTGRDLLSVRTHVSATIHKD